MQKAGRNKKEAPLSPEKRDGKKRKSKSKPRQRQSVKRQLKLSATQSDSKEKPRIIRSQNKPRRKPSSSRDDSTEFNLVMVQKLRQQQKSNSKGSRESTSSTKKSTSSEASEVEVGTTLKNLKSHTPTLQSINTLTSRVKRRELEMKKRWGSIEEESIQKEDGKTAPKLLERRKKPDDNYREVFPEVKLNFEHAPQTPPDPAQKTMPVHANTCEYQNITARKNPPNWTTKPEDFLRKPLGTVMKSSPTQNIKDMIREHDKIPIWPTEFTPSESLVAESTPQSSAEPREQKCPSPPMPTQFRSPQTLSFTGLPYIKNKNNRGKLFVNGEPFWIDKIREDVTDEENVLNAAVVLEVASGKLSLVNMPDESIVLDMYAEWSVLQSRDKKCFTKDVLFGNTVRSMVNLLETSEYEESIKARKALRGKINVLEIIDPTMVVYYMRDDLEYLTEEEFFSRKRKRSRRAHCK